jgi:hypothetical protein
LNHFGTEGPRTTNNIEAWNGKLKRKVQHSYPNIFTIIQTFKEIQNSNDINRIQREAGDLMTYADSASQLNNK